MSKLFELREKEAKLNNLNTRTEKFGDDGDKLAADVEFSFTTANDFLGALAGGLKASLYDRPQAPDLADTDQHMPVLRFPQLGVLHWERDWVNCKLTIHRGIREDSNIVLADCKVNKLRLTPKDGGSVDVRFRAQFYPDPEEPEIIGILAASLEAKVVSISLERPLDSEAEVQTNTPEPNPVEKQAQKKGDEVLLTFGAGNPGANGETPPPATRRRRNQANAGAIE